MYAGRKRYEDTRTSMIDKTLLTFREGKKRLDAIHRDIDRQRTQTCIDFKIKERQMRTDLIDLIKEQKRLTKETKRIKSSKQLKSKQQNVFQNEKQFILPSLRVQRNPDSFPKITCTETNVPKILKRSISRESETYNWTRGISKLGESSRIVSKPLKKGESKSSERASKKDFEKRDEELEKRRGSKVENITYNVPLSVRPRIDTNSDTDTKQDEKRNFQLPPIAEF